MTKILLTPMVYGLFFIFAHHLCNSQDQPLTETKMRPNQFVPPTPAAMKMTEYFAQRPNLYTGTANVNIPLYTIDFDGWKLPMSISYNATGIRTNEEAGEVGLGWALNATGVISRTVRGSDDLYAGNTVGDFKGYVYSGDSLTYNLGYTWDQETATNAPQPDPNSYYARLAGGAIDTQPDIFNYSFFGFSGSFVLSQKVRSGNINVIKITQNACSISFTEANGSNPPTFTVITPDGYKGEFKVVERSSTFSSFPTYYDISQNQIDFNQQACWGENYIDIASCKDQGRLKTFTSWYLSKITSPRNQQVTFAYDVNPTDGTSLYLSNVRSNAEQEDITSPPMVMQTIHEHVYLTSITSEEVNISFSMEPREDLRVNRFFTSQASGAYFTANGKVLQRYTGINIKGVDSHSTLNKSITFRQSYFNQTYQDLSSGDQNEAELRWLRSRLDRLIIDDQEHRFYYNNGIPDKLTYGIDHFGFYNGSVQNTQLLPPVSTTGAFKGNGNYPGDTSKLSNPETYQQRSGRRVSFNSGKGGLLVKVKYPTRGYTLFTYEGHTYVPDVSTAFREDAFSFDGNTSGNDGSGARISAINEYDYDGKLILSKAYKYAVDPTSILSPSTGKLMTPLYNRYAQVFTKSTVFNYLHKAFSSIAGGNTAEGKIIGYSIVHEIVNGNGESYRNTYYFENQPNQVLKFNAIALGYPNLNGQTKETRNYNSQGNIIQRTRNGHYNHPLSNIKSIVYENVYTSGCYRNCSPFLKYYIFYPIQRTFVSPDSVITYNGLSQGGFTDTDIANSTKVYDAVESLGKATKTIKTHTYNKDYLLKSEQVINSNGDILLTQYNRPRDYASPSSTLLQMLLNTVNIVNPVIEEISKKNGKTISANGNKYSFDAVNNKFNLATAYSYNKTLDIPGTFSGITDGATFQSSTSPTPYEQQTTYSKYDSHGNPLEYTARDGVTHSFIWGYNNKLPVVHGVGLSNTKLQNAYGSYDVNSPSFETSLRADPNVAGAQLTTYFHNPLVGPSKITDASNQARTFEYDTYSRLTITRDNNGKILTQNQYNFKTLPVTKILSVSPNTFNFGTFYYCHLPTPQRFTISNMGEDDLWVNTISGIPGLNLSWMGGPVYAGTSFDVIVTFGAGLGSSYSNAPFSITSTDANTTIPMTYSGTYQATGNNKSLQLSPNPLIFGYTFQTQMVTAKNNGDDCLNLTNLAVNPGTPWDPFNLDWDVTLPQVTLAPDESIPFSVTLKRNPPSIKQFDIDYTNGNSVTLYADMQRLELDVPNTFTFLPFTTLQSTQTFVATNTGNVSVTINSISNDNSPKFTVTPSSFTLAPGISQTITVIYSGNDFSTQTANLIFNGDLTRPMKVVATESQLYQLSISSLSLVLKPSASTQSSYITNTGNIPVTITSVSPLNSLPSDPFYIRYYHYSGGIMVTPTTIPYTLQPTETLRFDATVTDFTSGTGAITFLDDHNNTHIINLSKTSQP